MIARQSAHRLPDSCASLSIVRAACNEELCKGHTNGNHDLHSSTREQCLASWSSLPPSLPRSSHLLFTLKQEIPPSAVARRHETIHASRKSRCFMPVHSKPRVSVVFFLHGNSPRLVTYVHCVPFLCCILQYGEPGVLAVKASGEGVTGRRRRCRTAAPHTLEPTCVKLHLRCWVDVNTFLPHPKQNLRPTRFVFTLNESELRRARRIRRRT